MSVILTDGPRGLGYFEVQQKADDLPPGVARHFEADTYTCTHCQRVVVMNPARKRERYKCKSCAHHICDPCAAKMATGGGCESFARKVDEILEQTARGIVLP